LNLKRRSFIRIYYRAMSLVNSRQVFKGRLMDFESNRPKVFSKSYTYYTSVIF